MMKLIPIIFCTWLLFPSMVFAQGTIQSTIDIVGNIIALLASIGATLAFVCFSYGIAIFVLNASDEKKIEEGKSWMLWSIIALFLLFTIWGIIGLLQNTIGNTEGPGRIDIVIPRF